MLKRKLLKFLKRYDPVVSGIHHSSWWDLSQGTIGTTKLTLKINPCFMKPNPLQFISERNPCFEKLCILICPTLTISRRSILVSCNPTLMRILGLNWQPLSPCNCNSNTVFVFQPLFFESKPLAFEIQPLYLE